MSTFTVSNSDAMGLDDGVPVINGAQIAAFRTDLRGLIEAPESGGNGGPGPSTR